MSPLNGKKQREYLHFEHFTGSPKPWSSALAGHTLTDDDAACSGGWFKKPGMVGDPACSLSRVALFWSRWHFDISKVLAGDGTCHELFKKQMANMSQSCRAQNDDTNGLSSKLRGRAAGSPTMEFEQITLQQECGRVFPSPCSCEPTYRAGKNTSSHRVSRFVLFSTPDALGFGSDSFLEQLSRQPDVLIRPTALPLHGFHLDDQSRRPHLRVAQHDVNCTSCMNASVCRTTYLESLWRNPPEARGQMSARAPKSAVGFVVFPGDLHLSEFSGIVFDPNIKKIAVVGQSTPAHNFAAFRESDASPMTWAEAVAQCMQAAEARTRGWLIIDYDRDFKRHRTKTLSRIREHLGLQRNERDQDAELVSLPWLVQALHRKNSSVSEQ